VRAGGVEIAPDDLARAVDALRSRETGGPGSVKRGIRAAAQEEAVLAGVVVVRPDGLAQVVDAKCLRAQGGHGIVEGGVSAAAQEVAMAAGGVVIVPDDLVRIIDADCLGGAGKGQRIVEGVEGIDWHDPGSSVIVSTAVGPPPRRSGTPKR